MQRNRPKKSSFLRKGVAVEIIGPETHFFGGGDVDDDLLARALSPVAYEGGGFHHIDNKSVIEKDFTIIQMVSDDQDLIKYFFQVISIILQRLPSRPKVSLLKEEISKVIEIFMAPLRFSKETVRGLWAELLVIERSSNPEYLINAWHVEPEDKYDFNDATDKIEVKSTAGDKRSHIFSLEQLSPEDGSSLLIASVFVNKPNPASKTQK